MDASFLEMEESSRRKDRERRGRMFLPEEQVRAGKSICIGRIENSEKGLERRQRKLCPPFFF